MSPDEIPFHWSSPIGSAVGVLMTLGSVALLLSLGLTVATLLAFDRLAMPPEFWSEQHTLRRMTGSLKAEPPGWSVLRPPSEAVVVLFYEMMHTWKWLFEPALLSALASILCFFLAVVASKNNLAADYIFSALVVVAGTVVAFYQHHKPKLGFED